MILNKSYFTLNPFWSSPKIFNMSEEKIILICLNNSIHIITFYELKNLFGLKKVKSVYKKYITMFSKTSQKLIEFLFFLVDEKWKKWKNIKIDFFVSTGNELEQSLITENDIEYFYDNVKVASLESLKKQKVILLTKRNKIRDLFDVAYMIEDGILKIEEMFDLLQDYYLTTDNSFITHLFKMKKQDKNDEGLEGLVEEKYDFDGLKKYILIKMLDFIENENKQKIAKNTNNNQIKENVVDEIGGADR